MSGQTGLNIRRTQRHEVALPARLRVSAEHQGVVTFGAATGAKDGWVSADVIDFGSGGVGLMSVVYVPRGVVLDLEVLGLEGELADVLLPCRARVQRVIMTDRRPGYMIGTAFISQAPEAIKRINDLIALLEGDDVESLDE